MDNSFSALIYAPSLNARVAFRSDSSAVFREQLDLTPVVIDEHTQYMPWGDDNEMPFHVLDKIEHDETLSTCQLFNAELCYGAGLSYNTDNCSTTVQNEITDFCLDNNLPAYFLGVCQDFKHFGWCVTVLYFSANQRIVQLARKEAAYCRLSPADAHGTIHEVLYANWRRAVQSSDIEHIPLLNPSAPYQDLRQRILTHNLPPKLAIITRVPTADSTYYPIPHYAAIFQSKWYDIKQLIATAKKAKLENSAPIKYQIEIADKYWESIFRREHITDPLLRQQRVRREQEQIISFLTGAENAGKVWFSTFYVSPDGHEQHDVVINRIDSDKEGGDWETDIQEAVNIICFTMRVHSNLVGSVPGKAQTNNSGSDKRELYTIAQALQKPYHDLLFLPHRIIIRHNQWQPAFPETPFIQLTTLDSHTDAQQVTTTNNQ